MKHLAPHHGTWTESVWLEQSRGDLLNIGRWPILGPDPPVSSDRERERETKIKDVETGADIKTT